MQTQNPERAWVQSAIHTADAFNLTLKEPVVAVTQC